MKTNRIVRAPSRPDWWQPWMTGCVGVFVDDAFRSAWAERYGVPVDDDELADGVMVIAPDRRNAADLAVDICLASGQYVDDRGR